MEGRVDKGAVVERQSERHRADGARINVGATWKSDGLSFLFKFRNDYYLF